MDQQWFLSHCSLTDAIFDQVLSNSRVMITDQDRDERGNSPNVFFGSSVTFGKVSIAAKVQ